MRLSATFIAVLATQFSIASQIQAASPNDQPRSVESLENWTQPQSVRLEQSPSALPPVAFDPNLSVEENNAKLKLRSEQNYLGASARVLRSSVSVKSLVGKHARLHLSGGVSLPAEVYALRIDTDAPDYVTVFIRVQSDLRPNSPKLRAGEVALLQVPAPS